MVANAGGGGGGSELSQLLGMQILPGGSRYL